MRVNRDQNLDILTSSLVFFSLQQKASPEKEYNLDNFLSPEVKECLKFKVFRVE